MTTMNLKKPIIWAYLVWILYAFFLVGFFIAFSPITGLAKIYFDVLGFLVCILFGFMIGVWLKRPIPSDNIVFSLFPYPIGLIGFVQICVGSIGLYSLFEALPAILKVADTPWKWYLHISGAIQLPVGILIFIFSILQLVSNRKSR